MKYILTTLIILLALLTSCSNEESGTSSPAGPVTVSMSMISRAGQGYEAEDNELIHHWWVAFVNSDGKISTIVERGAELTAPVSEEYFDVELDPGSYTLYAFANMDGYQADRFGFRVGATLPEDIDSRLWTAVPDYDNSDRNLVPMSGKTEVVVRQQLNTRLVIEVVRLVAKMQLDITNASGEDLKINSFSMLPALTDKVTLMPEYTSLEKHPVMVEGAQSAELTHNLDRQLTNRQAHSEKFYLLESTASAHTTGHYIVKLNVTRSSGRTETLTAMTTDLVQWINRNDYIVLPLKVIYYSLSFDVLFYPPIGGYPAVLEERKGDEYFATFASSGRFVISPTVTGSDGTKLRNGEYTVAPFVELSGDEIEGEITGSYVKDPDRIFSVKPDINPVTHEIVGELATGNKGGTATVTLNITVPDKDHGNTEYIFSRTLYIIRQ